MRIPKDVDASQLIKLLKQFGYCPTRQSGSHIRLTTLVNGEHHLTVPNHKPIRTGTLSSIVAAVAVHFNLSKEEILKRLF